MACAREWLLGEEIAAELVIIAPPDLPLAGAWPRSPVSPREPGLDE